MEPKTDMHREQDGWTRRLGKINSLQEHTNAKMLTL